MADSAVGGTVFSLEDLANVGCGSLTFISSRCAGGWKRPALFSLECVRGWRMLRGQRVTQGVLDAWTLAERRVGLSFVVVVI